MLLSYQLLDDVGLEIRVQLNARGARQVDAEEGTGFLNVFDYLSHLDLGLEHATQV
jgi:hypothetical protein